MWPLYCRKCSCNEQGWIGCTSTLCMTLALLTAAKPAYFHGARMRQHRCGWWPQRCGKIFHTFGRIWRAEKCGTLRPILPCERRLSFGDQVLDTLHHTSRTLFLGVTWDCTHERGRFTHGHGEANSRRSGPGCDDRRITLCS